MPAKASSVNQPEEQANAAGASRTPAAKDGAAATGSTRQAANSNTSGSVSSATSTSHSSSTQPLTSSILPRMSDPTPPAARKSESPQPMDKPHASAAAGAAKDAAGEKASPYGTRSRNRTGAARPNYAEDKDIDMELFDTYPNRREDDAKKANTRLSTSALTAAASSSASTSTSASATHPAQRAVNGTGRKPLPPSDDSTRHGAAHHTNGNAKDHHANRQSPAATPSSATNGNGHTNGSAKQSKKRKAADSASNASGTQTPSASNAGSSALQKRFGSTGAQASGQATPNAGAGGSGWGETNILTFENCGSRLTDGKMVADDGTVLEVNDHAYLVCEPPGEPYYLGRIMEFLHYNNDPEQPIDTLRVNWYYRPKDIGRKVQDTRLVFATMHSDISPLSSLRGKCQIRHKAEIDDMAAYKRSPDCFWYEKLYDRYIQKNYEVIPTKQVINVPEHVKKVLDERWKFILVEQGRGKELTSAVKTCKRCVGYCASNDSVDCAVCQHTYHMNCVKPPLLKKPSRGFAWSCAACSRAQERKLEARNTPSILDPLMDVDDEELVDDEDEDMVGADTGRTSRTSPADTEVHPEATAEQMYHAALWPYRYLGIHCKVEDALDLDDRIFPRASTRLGPRHQAVVLPWPGRPVQYVKPLEIKKSGRKDAKISKEMQAAIEAERIKRENRPKWIQDEPPGYVERGGDDTAELLWYPPNRDERSANVPDEDIDAYMDTARGMANSLGLPPRSTNLQDVARDVFFRNNFDAAKSLKELPKVPKAEFKEPDLTPAEQKKFEEGVAKHGSELHSVMKHVKTVSPATIVRYYYTWKKTDRGKQIWGNFSGRKGKKDAKKAEAAANKLADDVADDHDDSAFDTEKAKERKKGFICKFCNTKSSRQWRRAPNAATTLVSENGGRNSKNDKKDQYIHALCRRCAELWRRYAIQWEDIDEMAKKVSLIGGRGWRRRVDEELLKELQTADEMMANTRLRTPDPIATASPASSHGAQNSGQEPPRKKLKGLDKDTDHPPSDSGSVSTGPASKKKDKGPSAAATTQLPAVEKQPAPTPIPELPKVRTLPCAICDQMEPMGDQHLSCRECRLTVHRNCYGIIDNRAPGKWTCDMCLNDKSPQIALDYKCVLCPVYYTEADFVEPPKISHKKKTEKERERERLERENAHKAAEFYRKRQEELNRPTNPREPLKRTADNNWIHVTCAVWTPEVKFGNAKALGPSEGIPSIPRARYLEACKACKKTVGACVQCHQCRAPVHVECAHKEGYVLGFDITPVKGSRRDHFNLVTIGGESGIMSAAVWCKDHAPTKTIVHRMHDIVDDSGMNALQLYVQNFKQADLTLTGCARKANQITLASKMSSPPTVPAAAPVNRRASTAALVNGDHSDAASGATSPVGRVCLTCGVDTSPRWHQIDAGQERTLTNGYSGNLGQEAQKFVEQRSFQCHKCKKANRQPKPHAQPVPKEAVSPPPEPPRAPSQAPPVIPPVVAPEPRHTSRAPYVSWSPPRPVPPPAVVPVQAAGLQAPVPGSMVPPLAPPAVQVPPVAPPPLPPTIAPRVPPVQAPPIFGSSSRSFGDWHHRPSTGSGAPPLHPARELNGGPSPPPTVIPPLANHLRPPPLVSHSPQMAPAPNGHMAQPPFGNGLPPSPRRLSGPTAPNGGSYLTSHQAHVPPDLRPHHMPLTQMSPPGPVMAEPPQPHNYLRQWSHHGPPHHTGPPAGPPPSAPLHRNPGSTTRPPREERPVNGGASSSPSLRNLLS